MKNIYFLFFSIAYFSASAYLIMDFYGSLDGHLDHERAMIFSLYAFILALPVSLAVAIGVAAIDPFITISTNSDIALTFLVLFLGYVQWFFVIPWFIKYRAASRDLKESRRARLKKISACRDKAVLKKGPNKTSD